MSRQKKRYEEIREKQDKMAPLVAEAQAQLRELDPDKLALRAGCSREANGSFRLAFIGQDYLVHPQDFTVRLEGADDDASSFIQALILTYLVTADGTTPSSRWVSFREIPDGMFYAQAFRGHAEDQLVSELDGAVDSFSKGAERTGGTLLEELGDAAYSFQVLPRISMAIVFWMGDDEFASRASVLFEDTACHYMSTEGLAILGSLLVSSIVKGAGAQ